MESDPIRQEVETICQRAQALGLTGVSSLVPGKEGYLSFCGSRGTWAELFASRSSLIVVSAGQEWPMTLSGEMVVAQDPRRAFALAARELFPPRDILLYQSREFPYARVASCYILEVGRNVEIGPGSTIGAPGFGWVLGLAGEWVRFPHYAGVVIEDNVTLGSCVTVDRGALQDTVIGAGTKIDNQVHVGHGAQIGKNVLVTAMSVIGGSAVVEEGAMLGMGALVRDNIRVGTGAAISMGAVVSQDVPPGGHVTGNLAIPHERFLRNLKASMQE